MSGTRDIKSGLLFVINDFNVGGAELFILRLGRALMNNYNIYIMDIHPDSGDIAFKKLFIDAGFNIINRFSPLSKFREWVYWKINALYKVFGRKGQFSILKNTYQKNKLRKDIEKEGIKIIHSHLYSSDCFVRNVFSGHRIKKIISMHGDYNRNVYEKMSKEQKIIFLENAQKNIAACDFLVNAADVNLEILNDLKLSITKSRKIYYGFEPTYGNEKKVQLNSGDEFTFCVVARANPAKGWKELVESFIVVNKKNPHTRLICVGPLEGILLDLQNKYNNNNSIIFTGYLEAPVEYISKSDVCLLPTYFAGESLPYSIIEYLSCGKPVIATQTCEIPSMLNYEGKSAGILINPGKLKLSQYDELINAMEKLMLNKEFYTEKAALAKLAFRKFSMENCKSEYVKIYSDLLS